MNKKKTVWVVTFDEGCGFKNMVFESKEVALRTLEDLYIKNGCGDEFGETEGPFTFEDYVNEGLLEITEIEVVTGETNKNVFEFDK